MKRPVDRAMLDAVKTFYAAGLNFRAHIEWANSRGGKYALPTLARAHSNSIIGFAP